ncbi:MAG TPA: DUF4349 domain-containing protein [Polyangiaceae bacterium]|nr:DUF4349 domain-containing protein [Polyangiaceae bacterium]
MGSSAAPAAVDARPAEPAGAQATTPTGVDARRIVKKASLELVVKGLGDAQAKAERIVEREGGFVASTENAAVTDDHQTEGYLTLTVRVPAEHFTKALEALRALGKGDGVERVTTEDVSEEFIDLEARLKVQRELETQFLDILKHADKVPDALSVQRELATVRTEIERMQGRKRFLEHETALSTITLTLKPEPALVRATFGDFPDAVVLAASDSVNVGAKIVITAIRALGVCVPLLLSFGLPLAFALRALGRARRRKLPAPLPDSDGDGTPAQ